MLAVPIFFLARWGVAPYGATIGAQARRSRFYQAVMASRAYNLYRLFRPQRGGVRLRIFRWKAAGPLLVLLAIVAVLVVRFAEPVARDTTEEASTELLGTQVDVAKLDRYPRHAAVELRGLEIADPFQPRRNPVEADSIRLKLNPAALTEKQLVIERFALRGMRFATDRRTPARPGTGKGFAPQTLRAVRQWGGQFDAPLLSLTPIHTVRQLVLDPGRLTTVRAAQALVARATRPARPSSRAFAPSTSTLPWTRPARWLGAGVQDLDSARRQDYAFARSPLKLPSFEAPEIGLAADPRRFHQPGRGGRRSTRASGGRARTIL